ncbi:hypothetical protein ACFL9U_17485 [Thermodesulfobacteriota bacterium]
MPTDFDTANRNKKIAVGILNGQLLRKAALEHGVSLERARQILHKYCEKKNPEAYQEALGETRMSRWTWLPSLEALREKKIKFVAE